MVAQRDPRMHIPSPIRIFLRKLNNSLRNTGIYLIYTFASNPPHQTTQSSVIKQEKETNKISKLSFCNWMSSLHCNCPSERSPQVLSTWQNWRHIFFKRKCKLSSIQWLAPNPFPRVVKPHYEAKQNHKRQSPRHRVQFKKSSQEQETHKRPAFINLNSK